MMIHSSRLYKYNHIQYTGGPVVYWMQRDQRTTDHWALHFAQQQALEFRQPLYVVFCLSRGFLGATDRQYSFMIKGLQEVETRLRSLNISFILLPGEAPFTLSRFLKSVKAGMVITDFNPLKIVTDWKNKVARQVDIPFLEVDAHNIIPCRTISDHQEYAAFTLRKKVEKSLPDFLTTIPEVHHHPYSSEFQYADAIDLNNAMNWCNVDRTVGEVNWIVPGESAGLHHWKKFLTSGMGDYATKRNFPDSEGQSDVSPYLHFGHLSAQRIAFDAAHAEVNPESKMAYLEELIVRRELADNFCLYNSDYDSFRGIQPWAKQTLNRHRDDPREYLYTPEEFEQAKTHDPLWNAAQKEMVYHGKMHGFMRMYWAKKILEWTRSPEEAFDMAIVLNDKYELDGRDPNGYAGIAWAIGGVHDRPWSERNVFGMIRFMNYAGCKRKFDIGKYIRSQHY